MPEENKRAKRGTRPNNPESKADSRVLIGEMMLAKTVLEEKNELLDQKDRLIRELRSQLTQREVELEELKAELHNSERDRTVAEQEAELRGKHKVVAEVVELAAEYERGSEDPENKLAWRLIWQFQERYGLEVISGTPCRVDPQIHRVIEVVHPKQPEVFPAIWILTKGFRLAGRTIKPALVRVIGSGKEENDEGRSLEDEPWRVA
ncbi:MAG: hypothetical protein JSV89_10665 [Spirochaetaceae bacterium]|nr:MAG: hypothetical protein JSV89_10665 [Spirochaetaceae bacterium]